MVKIIPAHIENGQVIFDGPLPHGAEGRDVSVIVHLDEPQKVENDDSPLSRLFGILRGVEIDDSASEYGHYLEEKYR